MRKPRRGALVELTDKSPHEFAPGIVGNFSNTLAYPVGPLQVPLQFAPHRRMREISQRSVNLPKRGAQAAQQFRRMRLESCEHRGGEVADKPNIIARPIRALCDRDLLTCFGTKDPGDV